MLTLSKEFQKIFFGSLSLFCFSVGVPSSFIALSTSIPGRGRNITSKVIYKLILITDFLICLLVLPICISNFNDWSPGLFASPFMCGVWSFLWGSAGRISVFLITILSIVRTKSLTSPLHPVKHRKVLWPVMIYIIGILVQGTVPWWYQVEVQFFNQFQSCVWFLDELLVKFRTFEQYLFYIITYLVEFVAPIVPVIVSGAISAFNLRNSKEDGCPVEAQRSKRHATRMILALTTIYVIFNIPYCLVLTLDSISMFSQNKFRWDENVAPPTTIFIYNFIYIHTIALNSVTNTIIYVYKMKSILKLKISIKNKVLKRRNTTNNTRLQLRSKGSGT